MRRRFLAYGALGWCLELLWTGLPRRRPVDWRLHAHTSWWMFPIYGLIAPLYEPAHTALRAAGAPWWARGLSYMAGLMGVEVVTGWLIERLTGAIPWDYRGSTRWQWRGLTRLDYAPLWFCVGLGLEPVHDWLAALLPDRAGAPQQGAGASALPLPPPDAPQERAVGGADIPWAGAPPATQPPWEWSGGELEGRWP